MKLSEVIAKHQDAPPVDIEAIARDLGVDLDMNASLHPEIVGQISRNGDAYRIDVQQTDHPRRKRFTAAHELAHYLLHRDILESGIDDSRAYRSVNVGRFNNKNIQPRHEREANALAAYLLMPPELVRKWHKLLSGDLYSLAEQFGVSPKAMEICLQNMKLDYQ